MRKEEYANLELDELIPMMCEIFAKIDIQILKKLFYEIAFCAPCDERGCADALIVAQLANWIAARSVNLLLFSNPGSIPHICRTFCQFLEELWSYPTTYVSLIVRNGGRDDNLGEL